MTIHKVKNNAITGSHNCFNCGSVNYWFAVVHKKSYSFPDEHVQGHIEIDNNGQKDNGKVFIRANVLYSCEVCGVNNRIHSIEYEPVIQSRS